MVLLFKYRQCIITTPVTPTTATPDYEALTNQGDALTSIYTDYIAYLKRTIVTNPKRVYSTIRITCPRTRLFYVLIK
jgi:hypothetical protein